MKRTDFSFDLPEELIAQTPLQQRDASRLLCLDKTTGALEHAHFYDLPKHLRPGDCLVLNDSRVLPARLIGARPSGGTVELVLLRDLGEGKWECLSRPGRKTRPGQELLFGDGELPISGRSCRTPSVIRPSIPGSLAAPLPPPRACTLPGSFFLRSKPWAFGLPM